MRFVVVMVPEPEVGGFSVSVRSLPGSVTQGETVEDCLLRARDAIEVSLTGETSASPRAAGVDPGTIVDVVDVPTGRPA